MLTSEQKNHKYGLEDKASVLEHVSKLLDNPQFNGVNVSIGQEWPVGAEKPTKFFALTEYIKHATDK